MRTDSTGAARTYRWGLIALASLNLLNYLDRFVVSSLAESIKRSELSLSDAQLGSLMTGFIVVYMLASPVFGTLGDRRSRTRLIAFGVALWSLATVLSGLATSFPALFAARAAVGIGEAAYGTIAPCLLADYYPRERLGRVYAVFYAAMPVGSALGYIVGGLVDRHFGWRSAFFVAGAPGLLLALLCLLLVDPPRGAQDPDRPAAAFPTRGILETYRSMLSNRTYMLTVAAYAAYTFAMGAMAFWMPAFLERARGIPRQEATVQFGAVVVVAGLVGTFAGGHLGDLLFKRTKAGYLWLCAGTTLLATPLVAVALTAGTKAVFLPALALGLILLFAVTGPVSSAIVNVVSPAERATSVAFFFLVIHLFGDVPSPPLIGALSDRSSLQQAMLLLPAGFLVAAILWSVAAVQEREAAPRPAPSGPPPV